MITKMTKYSFLMLAGEKEGFLEKLQELGVVDITRSAKPVDSQSQEMMDKILEAQKTLELLSEIDYSKDNDYKAVADAVTHIDISGEEDKVAIARKQMATLETLKLDLVSSNKEMETRHPWGDFDQKKIAELEALGYKVRYYHTESKRFKEEWQELYPLQIIENNGKEVWFVTITEADADYDFPIKACAAPDGTYSEAVATHEQIKKNIVASKAKLLKIKEASEEIDSKRKDQLVVLDRYFADAASESAAENMISVITGFAPTEEDDKLCQEFDKMDVFYLKEAAVEEDNPPIKLKNNWFVRQFEVLTGMYGMPVYSEFDPTCIVAPFFLLFFSMCMGDGGYGIFLILFGLAVKKNWINIDMFKGLGNIIMLLGGGTLVVGTILGTFFGIDLTAQAWVPAWMKSCMITGDINGLPAQMVLALGVGVFHICLAMTVKAICYTKRFGFKKTVSTWGWLLLILGGIITAVLALTETMSAEAIKWTVIIIASISALGIYIFNTPGRNPLMNIGSGLWDTYNMATGILGDVLSYVRLYALGLAGGMLGGAFNTLGLMVLGDGGWTWVPFIIILILGHLLNIAMSALGAFVHPLRLNFVEYFKNSGYEGMGAEYNPLTKNKE